MYNPFTLEGKIILVTGASSGIGKAIAIECSKLGASMIITARDTVRLNDTYAQLHGRKNTQITADLTNSDELMNLVKQLPELNGCVNNAGIEEPKLIQHIKEDDIKKVFSINSEAPFLLTHLLVKNKLLVHGASLVYISSISGVYCSMLGGALYSASKGAMNGFIKAAALELAPKKIRVNGITPGMILTNLLKGELDEEQIASELKKYPLQRFGKPEEIAYSAAFLLSDASQWITGSNLVIDGGYTLL